MSFIAIAGAGAIGGALAHKLASRGRVPEVRLIDADVSIARGKALDISQSSPVEGFSTKVSASEGIDAASGAAAVVLADAAATNQEHAGEGGLALVRRLVSLELRAPVVFAGAAQREMMARVVRELRVQPRRVLGSAASALESAVRALTALELDGTGVEVQLRVVGVPPHAAVIAWEEATAYGMPVSSLIPPHRLAAIDGRVGGLWPPGPYALASAAARVAEAVMNGSRRRYTCFVSIEEGPNRGAVTAMPAELGSQGVVRVFHPVLTRQERTRLENGLAV